MEKSKAVISYFVDFSASFYEVGPVVSHLCCMKLLYVIITDSIFDSAGRIAKHTVQYDE